MQQEELERARHLKQSGKPQQAIEILLSLLVASPNKPELHRLVGELYEQTGDADAARRHFERLLELKPKSLQAMMGLGRMARQTGHLDEAQHWFAQVLEQNAAHIGALRNMANLLHLLHRDDEAEQVLLQAAHHHPDDLLASQQLVELWLKRKNYFQAEALLERALQYHADSVALWHLLFKSLKAQKKYPALLQATEAAMNKLADKPAIAAERMEILQRVGEYEAAMECARLSEVSGLKHPHYISTWGQLMLGLGALKELRNFLAMPSSGKEESNVTISKLMLQATLEKDAANFQDAIQSVQQILEINPSHKRALELLIECDIFLFRLDSARQQIEASPYPHTAQHSLLNEAKLFPEVIAALKDAVSAGLAGAELVIATGNAIADTPQCMLSTRFWSQQLACQPQLLQRNSTGKSSIPMKIFQYWHREVPADLLITMNSWQQATLFDGYRLLHKEEAFQRLHDYDSRIDAGTFEQMNPQLHADLLRLLMLYQEGGIWINADCRLRHPFPQQLLSAHDLVLVMEGNQLSTQFMAAAAGMEVIKAALDEAIEAALAQPEKPHHQTSGATALATACAAVWGRQLANDKVLTGVSLLYLYELKPYISFSVPHDYHRSLDIPFQMRERLTGLHRQLSAPRYPHP